MSLFDLNSEKLKFISFVIFVNMVKDRNMYVENLSNYDIEILRKKYNERYFKKSYSKGYLN